MKKVIEIIKDATGSKCAVYVSNKKDAEELYEVIKLSIKENTVLLTNVSPHNFVTKKKDADVAIIYPKTVLFGIKMQDYKTIIFVNDCCNQVERKQILSKHTDFKNTAVSTFDINY